MPPPVQKNQVVELEIETLAYGGMGLGRIDDYVIFVRDAIPGDRVKARIRKRRSNHSQADLESIIEPSPNRIEPPCPLHDGCGGCVWQNMDYKLQLEAKQSHVAEALRHLGGQTELPMEPIIPSPRQWRYRNKMEFTFGRDSAGETILGFHRPGRFDRIFTVPACHIQPEPFDAVIQAAQQWARQSGLPPYDPRSHKGVLRSLMLRYSESEKRWLAVLITKTTEVGDKLDQLAALLGAAAEGLAGMLWGFYDGVADLVRMDHEAARVGDPSLEERLDSFRFRVSPFSFFQTNTQAAVLLYRCVREFASLSGSEILLDAYCGTGAIGIFCASEASKVYGIEVAREAVWDARANARANGLDNCQFIAAHLADGLRILQGTRGARIDRVIIDPPRGGMDKRSLRHLLALKAPVFVYVSCNPSTLARDVEKITESGYTLTRVKPVDMFPHTFHVEAVLRFELAN